MKIDLPRATGSAWKVPDRLLRVLLEVVEERRLVALGHAGEDREVDLERLLDLVEDAAQSRGRRIRDDRVGLLVGEQDDVELRAEALHELRQHQAVGRPARGPSASTDSREDSRLLSSGTSRADA